MEYFITIRKTGWGGGVFFKEFVLFSVFTSIREHFPRLKGLFCLWCGFLDHLVK